MLFDSGNFSDNPSPQGTLKTKTLLQAMELLGYEVVNVGERDIRMGYDEFAKRTEGSKFRFISANIVRKDNQEPIFDPHAVVEAASAEGDKLRVGVIGVVRYNSIFMKAGPEGSNMVIIDPVEPVKREMQALREKKVDLIVLLSAQSKDDSRRLAQQVSGIDLILGSYGGMFTLRGEQEGDTSIVYCGNRGQRFSETRFFITNPTKKNKEFRRVHKMHFLTGQYPSKKEMQDFLDAQSLTPEQKQAPSTTSSNRRSGEPRAAR